MKVTAVFVAYTKTNISENSMNKVITPEHIRAPFIECLVDDIKIEKVAFIDIELKQIGVYAEDGQLTYKDLEGNTTTVTAVVNSLTCDFKPRKFKAYDSETSEVYAEWDTYEN